MSDTSLRDQLVAASAAWQQKVGYWHRDSQPANYWDRLVDEALAPLLARSHVGIGVEDRTAIVRDAVENPSKYAEREMSWPGRIGRMVEPDSSFRARAVLAALGQVPPPSTLIAVTAEMLSGLEALRAQFPGNTVLDTLAGLKVGSVIVTRTPAVVTR